jgi:hypothetical protein
VGDLDGRHFEGRQHWIKVKRFKWTGVKLIHVLGLEVDEEHNDKVRVQIS